MEEKKEKETSSYSELESSIMLVDKSGWQSFQLSLSHKQCDVFGFLESKDVQPMITESSIPEIWHQTYSQNLFAGEHVVVQSFSPSSVTRGGTSEQMFVLSGVNGALTTLNIDPRGFPVGISRDHEIPRNPSLWETTSHWKHLSSPDKSIVFVARYLAESRKSFFILANDKDLCCQLDVEGFHVLKSAQLLCWMKESDFISSQKARRIYEGWGRGDPGSVKKNTTFGGIFHENE